MKRTHIVASGLFAVAACAFAASANAQKSGGVLKIVLRENPGRGTRVGQGVVGTMDYKYRPLSQLRSGGFGMNRTGLQGYYALTLTWAPRRGPNAAEPADDLPDFFTALQEQLGLKLQPEKARLPVFVVDSIERPSEN